jgi:hypothetical protein
MVRKVFKLIMTSVIAAAASTALAETDYSSVLSATQSIIENRTFKNDDGDVLSFGLIHIHARNNSEIITTIRMKAGEVYKVRERIWGSGNQTFIEQSTDNQNIGRFLVTVEAPFNVLRMRPLNPGESSFISRECAFDAREDRRVCYFKMKHDHDVLISTFWETRNP